MGKPKYYEGQVLEHRETGLSYFISGISDEYSWLYFVRPIEDAGKQYTPNEGVLSMVVGHTKMNRTFRIPPKAIRKDKGRTLKILYGKIQKR